MHRRTSETGSSWLPDPGMLTIVTSSCSSKELTEFIVFSTSGISQAYNLTAWFLCAYYS